MKIAFISLGILVGFATAAVAQRSYTSNSATGAWNEARWNNSADEAPYTSTFTANNSVSFTSGNYTFAGMGAATNVGNISVAAGVNVTFTSTNSTYGTGGQVRTIDVGAGGLFDLNANSISTASGTGLTKNGAGVFGTGIGIFGGGFTLNAGTVIARGITGLGSGATHVLRLNGGTLASNASRDFTDTRFGGGIIIGGNVQFGALASTVSLASDTANLSFANNLSLGAGTRVLTVGNNGTQTFSGIISNASGGITFAANPGTTGRFDLTNAGNTFTGNITITGGEARFTSNGSMGNAANDIIIDGGRFATASSASFTLGAGRSIFVGDGVGTAINIPGSGTIVVNTGIADKSGEVGSWAKLGPGTLELGGVSSYTGDTVIHAGTLRLAAGNDRLPTRTVLSLGRVSSTNLGTLDLNGRNQQIAGLQSLSGTNLNATLTNLVTSATAATLTINSTGDFTFGDGTAANSGRIAGAIHLVKQGSGNQTLGGNHSYTGNTTVDGGNLILSAGSVISGNGTIAINANATLTLQSTASMALGTSNLVFADGTLDIDAGGAVDLSNPFSGNGTIRLLSGTLNLAGASPDYLGRIIVNEGLTLSASGSADFGAATFNLGGLGATLDFSALPSITIFNVTGSGALIGNTIIITDPNFNAGSINTSGVSNLKVVPEPHEYTIMIVGLLGILIVVRRVRASR